MSWHFSRALVEEFSAGNSLVGALFAPSNGSPTPRLYLPHDRMTAFFRLSRFGMTFAPLTDDLGAGLLTWFQGDFLARTSAPPAEEKGSTVNAPASGAKWRESLAKYDPDSRSWKTRQFSLLGDSELFSETWPRWGMTADGESFLLPTPERHTSERGSGLWASPASADAVGSHGGGQGRSLRTDIHNWKRGNWPTPRSNDAEKRGDFDATNPRNGLPGAVKQWPTPLSTDGSKGGPNQRGTKGDLRLSSAVHGGPSTPPTYPTPTKSDGSGGPGTSGRQGGENLRTNIGGQLNPEWVEWLMGWPLGWTDLKPLATDRFQRWLDLHGES